MNAVGNLLYRTAQNKSCYYITLQYIHLTAFFPGQPE